jgi:protein involved in polysaccharide export with SLBB domain
MRFGLQIRIRHGMARGKYSISMTVACTSFVLLALSAFHANAGDVLPPQTKLRVSVVQWVPAKGEYQQWSAVNGDYVVSAAGTITLPLIGSITASKVSNTELASTIAEQLKAKTGLLNVPDATVEILDYPPIYVVGVVAKSGEYKYRPGLTVLQAFALSGGQYRLPLEGAQKSDVDLIGDLQIVRDDILRTIGRIARLQAEGAGDKEIRFPKELTESPNKKTATDVMNQERVVFEARKNGLNRQLENLSELRSLFAAEVDNLGKKAEALDKTIRVAEDELTSVRALFEKGIATVSRRSEIERVVAGLQADRLDDATVTMRTRQNLSESTRNAVGLRDQRAIDVSIELNEAQANIQRLRVREDVLEKTLVLATASSSSKDRNKDQVEPSLSFTIIRQVQAGTDEIVADETTALLPGDVVKVALSEGRKQASIGLAGVRPSQ